jgi:hypothetical protein
VKVIVDVLSSWRDAAGALVVVVEKACKVLEGRGLVRAIAIDVYVRV